MNQIKAIQLGVVAICIATVPLSSAQTPRTRTSGSNQTGAITTTAAPIHSGSNGNSTRATQTGINAGSATNTGAHTATNAGVQTGISNQGTGITRAVTGNGGSIGSSTGATQTGINAATGTNTTANTNAGGHTGSAAATPTIVTIIQPQFTQAPTQGPLPNNDPLGPNFSTPGQSPSPSPSASVSPTPTPPPI
jgi:hypothetical protein